MSVSNFSSRFRAVMRLPSSIRNQVLAYWTKRLVGGSGSRHEIMWTSFAYYAAEHPLEILEETGRAYRVRIPEGTEVWIRKTPSSDVFVFFQLFISQEYQPLIDELSAKDLRVMNIVDAGANVGYFTILCAHMFPGARVLSLEPAPSNMEQLKKNLGLSAPGAQPVHGALWINREGLQLTDPNAEEWSFSMQAARGGASVDCSGITLADLRNQLGVRRLDLLKIDVEGAESVLFTNTDFLNELSVVNVLAMEIHDQVTTKPTILSILKALDFSIREAGELTIAINRRR